MLGAPDRVSGIGRATMAMLAATIYTPFATARRPDELVGINAALAHPVDVTDVASTEAAVEAVLERSGRIDVLVNNAGTPCTEPSRCSWA